MVKRSEEAETLKSELARHAGGVSPETPDCLSEATIAAMAEGRLEAEARSSAMAHMASCPRCRAVVASVARALADPTVERESRRVDSDRRRGRSVGRIVKVAAGAAAATLLLLAWPQQVEEPPSHRAPPITLAPAAEAVWPVGAVADVSSLSWTAVGGADLYRAVLFDAEGGVLYEIELADTVAALPDSVQPEPGESYWWQVEARLGFDRWVASDLVEFSVRGPPR